MKDRYLPVPMWNNISSQWEPIDFRNGQKVMEWPDGFDPARLPDPEYRDGDRVQFVRDETCTREGTVRLVLLKGGEYGPLERVEDVIERWYCNPDNMIYVVTARNHDHQIRPWNIVGWFVSLRERHF